MAATIAKVKGREADLGPYRAVLVDVTGDASYPIGGYAITPRGLGFARVIVGMLDAGPVTAGAQLRFVEYDRVNSKVKIQAAGVEVANASNQSTVTRRVMFLGY
jgi:hypothetical protein